jgi:cyclophilin family peptidyl-prolyl cis-trans isomerase
LVTPGRSAALVAFIIAAAASASAQQPQSFATTLAPDQMKDKQAVVETTLGTFIIDLLPEAAPNHVGYFIKVASEGGYNGTVFHRVIPRSVVMGGDPISKDPAKRDLYGAGGFGVTLKGEPGSERHTRGAVSATLVKGDPDSAGSQFLVCLTDQPKLDGVYTVFGRVSEGILVVEKISAAPADDAGRPADRIEVRSVTIRDRPPAGPEPFSTETAEDLARYRAVLETSFGDITLEFLPDRAPDHVRNFLRLASAGVYDGVAFDRVVPGFVVQSGFVPTRNEPLSESQQRFVRTLSPEFSSTPHVRGTLSMARWEDPASASTSFFISTATNSALDGKYTVFGRVVDGLKVVDAIEAVPVDGEKPRERVELRRVRVERQSR